jgi:hypothetical protein
MEDAKDEDRDSSSRSFINDQPSEGGGDISKYLLNMTNNTQANFLNKTNEFDSSRFDALMDNNLVGGGGNLSSK